MGRLDIERQEKLQPKRMSFAKEEIEKKGYEVNIIGEAQLQFESKKGNAINFFPYSGWASGADIIDGRGLNNLLNQI